MNKLLILALFLLFLTFTSEVLASGSSIEGSSEVSTTTEVISEKNAGEQGSQSGVSEQNNKEFKGSQKGFFAKVFDTWEKELFWAGIAMLFAYLLVVVTEWLKEPEIYFSEAPDKSDPVPGDNNRRMWKFVHIRVKNFNKKLPKFSKITPTTQVASSAKATIILKDGPREVKFVGRWSSLPQPIQRTGNVYIPDINLALVHPREDIHPQSRSDNSENETKNVAIGLKYEGEDEFYAFNNENYINMDQDYKLEKFKFGNGTFKGSLALSTLGLGRGTKFTIYNKSSKLDDFYIKLNN